MPPKQSKLISLAEAAALVRPGMMLALGGMTLYRRPVAFVRALLRQPTPPGDLTLLCFTAGIESDLLVGAGRVRAVRACYFGLEIFGFAPMFSVAGNAGTLTIIEETEASIAAGLRATMSGIGAVPSRAWIGTGLPALRPDVGQFSDPVTGEAYTAFPAIAPDVAVIHALEADSAGNARLNTNWGIDRELALAAKTVIVTAETIVEHLREDVTIAGLVVSAVVHAAHGAWPTSCYPYYPIQGGEILNYLDACSSGNFDAYLNEFVRDRNPI